jgi:MT0933-like antitoxin protein
MGFLDDAMDKAKDAIAEHDEQVDDAIERAGDILDDKTGDVHTDNIDKGVDFLQDRTGAGDTNP